MKKAKRWIGILLVLAMAFTLGACGGGGSDAGTTPPADSGSGTAADSGDSGAKDVSSLKIGVVMKSFDEFQQQVIDGAKQGAKDAGIPEANVTAVAPNNESEIMAQVQSVEDLIAKNVDILLIAANQADTLMNALNTAAEKGIKVVMVDTDAPDFKDKVTYIGTDNYEAAYEGAKEFGTRLGGGKNVVILRGKLGDPNHEKRTEGLVAGLEETGNTVLETQDANCESDKAANAMEAFITKYPNQIDAVMVTSDSMAVGAAQAIKGAGLGGKIKVCGFDGFQAAIDLVATGEIEMIIAQKPFEIGRQGVECALGALDGKTYDPYINTGIAIIDGDNYKDYQD
ncbi:sugar ABC transporter substrate-binding protein [Intestinibacillus massiliensis]|uniref:sugar ABC transporter substrate-binding protein n=1 Tax=Intestinibacillus massiliensis TaxID=1871029 RepID=UPI000B34C9F1|nr:sugar ABC transporter substrate-binding protein [Intestinibacillus massiliensis]MCB6365782.1 sugar ABC transporter substrate-binding protein [Intestinibacillus massiliensis]